jgi:NAD(P)-dependent dehydrogenase (short-subunit alcohol dehydrogenase family)
VEGAAVDLQGKVALVTGASRGVGAATAVALAEAGCMVACAARSTENHPQRTPGTLDEVVRRIEAAGGYAVALPTNLAVQEEVFAMVDTTAERFGRLDILVNNAAITFVGDLDMPLHRHDLVMEVDLRAPILATRQAVTHMRTAGGGHVINVSSAAAFRPFPGLMTYGIAKIGLEHFTLDAARELQSDAIQVNCFRIDIPVASEGFVANTPGMDRTEWEPPEVAAEGILWMLSQPMPYSGRRESMYALRARESIMPSRAERPYSGEAPHTELFNGLAQDEASHYREPY